MSKFALSAKADLDLDGIYDYTLVQWSLTQADRYHKLLMDACRQIARDPARGKRYEGIAENMRGFRVGKHIIFYMEAGPNEVLIVRILHNQMDLQSRIGE